MPEKRKGYEMPRLQLKALNQYEFQTELVVRTTDLNYGGHLGNDRLLSLVHEARVGWLHSHQWSELDCCGVGLIMSDAGLVYRAEAFAAENLLFEVAGSEITRCGFRIFYRISRPADSTLIALAETGMTCFDYQNRKIASLPEAVAKVCSFS